MARRAARPSYPRYLDYQRQRLEGRFVDETVREPNGAVEYPESFDRLDQLIEAQAYRFADWRGASDEIKLMALFYNNELAGLRMEQTPKSPAPGQPSHP